jgi:D-alanine-D-alanine ligase
MPEKIKVAVLYGGRSAEHEVSLVSAENVLKSIDKEKYDILKIKIDKQGNWSIDERPVILSQNYNQRKVFAIDNGEVIDTVDVLFPVLHGPYGEDGSIQGFARLAGIPCVGPGILASAAGMDKDVAKRLLRDSGIPVANFITLRKSDFHIYSYADITARLGSELFVKPANMGSSVGVSFSKSEDDFWKAVNEAFLYDIKVIVEEKISGREIECAILGNDKPQASIPGEILPTKSFYSYESKYLDENDARLDIPAILPPEMVAKVQETALKTYQCLGCTGMTRVDMFLTPDGKLIINEVNTIPGFTKISMYPALWQHSGIPQSRLIDMLIQFAIEEFNMLNSLESSAFKNRE